MKRIIAHISDLHFGRITPRLVDALAAAVWEVNPHILAVSGDLTQHASPAEFMQARNLLNQLPGHQIVVPGNHDMSFYNVFRRATQRLHLFRRLITDDRQPFYSDDHIAVLGLNTARVSHLRNGRIRDSQVVRMEEAMRQSKPGVTRILVTHHPFDLPSMYPGSELLGFRRQVIKRVVACVDVLLAGHMHISSSGHTAERFHIAGHSAIFVQAGTALSTRVRGELNSFNVLSVDRSEVSVQQMAWVDSAQKFQAVGSSQYERSDKGWARVVTQPALR